MSEQSSEVFMEAGKVQLVTLQAGAVVEYPPVEPGGKPWRSAIDKQPLSGPVFLTSLGLENDQQSDHRHHGGPDRAVNVYPAEHYNYWRATHGLELMTGGAFGENFTTLGLLEHTACIGDVFRVGEAVVEISQPRGPCYKLNRRWQYPDLQRRAEETHRYGWYMRVRQEGLVEGGLEMTMLEHPFPTWTVRRVYELMQDHTDSEAVRSLVACPALADGWREALQKIAQL